MEMQCPWLSPWICGMDRLSRAVQKAFYHIASKQQALLKVRFLPAFLAYKPIFYGKFRTLNNRVGLYVRIYCTLCYDYAMSAYM